MNFNSVGGTIFDVILKLYIAVLFIITICSLGNRPKGSKMTYGLTILLFGLCNVIEIDTSPSKRNSTETCRQRKPIGIVRGYVVLFPGISLSLFLC